MKRNKITKASRKNAQSKSSRRNQKRRDAHKRERHNEAAAKLKMALKLSDKNHHKMYIEKYIATIDEDICQIQTAMLPVSNFLDRVFSDENAKAWLEANKEELNTIVDQTDLVGDHIAHLRKVSAEAVVKKDEFVNTVHDDRDTMVEHAFSIVMAIINATEYSSVIDNQICQMLDTIKSFDLSSIKE